MALADRLQAIEPDLPEGWSEARLRLTIRDDADCDRAAALLGPAAPGRHGKRIDLVMGRGGRGSSPGLVRRLFQRLDRERIDAELELVSATEAEAGAAAAPAQASLAAAWDRELEALPSDWTDLYAELELASTDYLERAALLAGPVNPARYGGRTAFRFRCARRFGYGASPAMVRRCLERLDAEGIRGRTRLLRVLSDTRPVYTQGPVWYVEGRSV